jgi:two-component system response regulator GlrR
LIVLEDVEAAALLVQALTRCGLHARVMPTMSDLEQLLSAPFACSAFVCDVYLPYPPLGMPVGFALRGLAPNLPIFGLASTDNVGDLLKLSQFGADHALCSLSDPAHQAAVIAGVLEGRKEALIPGCVKCGALVTTCSTVTRLVSQARKLSDAKTSILITGPTGAGKELLANIISKSRTDRALVSLNCAAMPDSLIESELFGYTQGAFSGATKASPGLIEQADGGVLFLDEVGEMTLQTQAKLLRVLDTGEVRPLGGGVARHVHFQLVCATHRDLERMCADGLFRRDLYYRIVGVRLKLPPLEERRSDIALLAQYFAAQIPCRSTGMKVTFSGPSLQELCRMAWPGNVRQLRNLVNRCASICSGSLITLDVVQKARFEWTDQLGLPLMRDLLTRESLLLALQVSAWRVQDAAKLCGRNRTDMYRLISRYRLYRK